MTEGRREVKELTGQPAVPVLITDERRGDPRLEADRRVGRGASGRPAGPRRLSVEHSRDPFAPRHAGIRRAGANRHLIVCLSSQTSKEMCKVPRLR